MDVRSWLHASPTPQDPRRTAVARADLLIDLVSAGAGGNRELFRSTLEALISEERAKQHHVLADRLAEHLHFQNNSPNPLRSNVVGINGQGPPLFQELRPRRRLDDLLLPAVVLQACNELVEEQNRVDLLRAHNLEPRHRMLLIGPPGNGKTSLAEAVAFELGCPLLIVRYETIIGSYLGETALRLAKLFAQARSQRCVLFFDEFDAIGKERGDAHETGEIKRVVSSLLLQVDELPSHVVVASATNHSELLDRAAWRRFQLRLELPSPTKMQRIEWLRKFEERSGMLLGYSHDHLARRLAGLSFAEIEQFALDIQRRYVLTMPNSDIRAIVAERLKQWGSRSATIVTAQRESDG